MQIINSSQTKKPLSQLLDEVRQLRNDITLGDDTAAGIVRAGRQSRVDAQWRNLSAKRTT